MNAALWEHFEYEADMGVRGLAEEAPGAYKDVSVVVEAADQAGTDDLC